MGYPNQQHAQATHGPASLAAVFVGVIVGLSPAQWQGWMLAKQLNQPNHLHLFSRLLSPVALCHFLLFLSDDAAGVLPVLWQCWVLANQPN